MDWRTASSNSMGPGMSSVGCSGWVDMVDEVWTARRGGDGAEEEEDEKEAEPGEVERCPAIAVNRCTVLSDRWRWGGVIAGTVGIARRRAPGAAGAPAAGAARAACLSNAGQRLAADDRALRRAFCWQFGKSRRGQRARPTARDCIVERRGKGRGKQETGKEDKKETVGQARTPSGLCAAARSLRLKKGGTRRWVVTFFLTF